MRAGSCIASNVPTGRVSSPSRSQEVRSSSAVDARVLRHLLDDIGGDEVELSALIGLFVDSAPLMLERMKVAVVTRDRLSLRHEAHALAGMASTLGATRLAAACALLEADALVGAFVTAAARLPDASDELPRVLRELRDWHT